MGSSYTRGPWFDALKLHHIEANIVSERETRLHQKKRNMLGPGVCTFVYDSRPSDVNMKTIAFEQELAMPRVNGKSTYARVG